MNRQRLDSPLVYVGAHNVYYVKLPVKVLSLFINNMHNEIVMLFSDIKCFYKYSLQQVQQ